MTEFRTHPPVSDWDNYVDFESTSWPKKDRPNYGIIPSIGFNFESTCGLLAPVAMLGIPSAATTVPPVPVAQPSIPTEAEPRDEARDSTERPAPPPDESDESDEQGQCQTRCGRMTYDAFSSTLRACGINPRNSGCTYHGEGQFSNAGDEGSGACKVTFDLKKLGPGARAELSDYRGEGSDGEWIVSDSAYRPCTRALRAARKRTPARSGA